MAVMGIDDENRVCRYSSWHACQEGCVTTGVCDLYSPQAGFGFIAEAPQAKRVFLKQHDPEM